MIGQIFAYSIYILNLCNRINVDKNKAQLLISYIQDEHKGVFRSASFIEYGEQLGVSRRTLNSYLSVLKDEGLIIKCKNGLFVSSEAAENDKDLALARVGMLYQPDGIVSLDSAIDPRPLKDQDNGVIHMTAHRGKVGILSTPIGDINIYSVSQRLQSDMRKGIGSSTEIMDEEVPRHTQEAAIVLASYLSKACGLKSGYMPSTKIEPTGLSPEKIQKAASAISLKPEYIEETIESVVFDEGATPSYEPF